MPTFEFFGVGRVICGRGTFARVGELAASLGSSTFVVFNGDTPGAGGAVDRLKTKLDEHSIRSAFYRQQGEPTVAGVDRAIEAGRTAGADCVVAIGGGSAIDCGKAVAALLANGGAALDYMEVIGRGQKITRPSLPWLAIPTTAGTGAEATRNAVVGDPEKRFKASIRSEWMLPRMALLDPELATRVPPAVTASSGMDALCQLIESYTSTGANPFTEALSLRGVDLARKFLRRAVSDGDDLDAREGMGLAALFSGMTLTSAGLGAVHGFAAPLGANFPVPHGVVCAALLPHVIAANVETLRRSPDGENVLARYAELGMALGADRSANREDAIQSLISTTADLVADFQIPSLSSYGLSAAGVGEMVGLARKASSMRFNPVVLPDEVLAAVLTRAIGPAASKSA